MKNHSRTSARAKTFGRMGSLFCAGSMAMSLIVPVPVLAKSWTPAQTIMKNAALMPQAETLTEKTVDDTDASIAYSAGNANNGGWTAGGSGDPAATEHYANQAGASLTFTFTGQKVEIYGVKAPNHRKFSVSIDDGEAVTCDAWAESRTGADTLLFSSEDSNLNLDEKEHTLKLTILDEANAAASGTLYGMSVTYFKVWSSGEPEPFKGYTIVEDMDITEDDELFKVKYNGNWKGGGTAYPDAFHDGYEHYAYDGDSFEMKFIGNKVEMWATKAPGHGVYTFSIDGVEVGTASATSDTRVNQQLIWASDTLEEGEHTLKVELKDQPDMAIQLDYLKVYHEELTPISVSLHSTATTAIPGTEQTLEKEFQPWNSTGTLVWTSSDPTIAAVDENGKVTIAGKDVVTEKKKVTIMAALKDHPEISASIVLNVDPDLSTMNAYVGNEKLLDLPENYSSLYAGEGDSFKGTLWKNDTINSKVNVASMGEDLHNVELSFSDFVNEDGDKLPASAMHYGWLETTTANIGRGNSGAPVKEFPDLIGNPGKITIPAQSIRFAWIQFGTTASTKPGTYKGKVRISCDEASSLKELDYTLEVINVQQPDPELTGIQLWQHPFSVADNYLGLGANNKGSICTDSQKDFYFTQEHLDLMRDSYEDYAAIGGHDAVANIVDQAWGHQSFYNDLSMVQWTKKSDGTWDFDYSWYDTWINFMIECGVLDPANGIGQIKAYSIVPWNNQISWFDEATSSTKSQTFTPGSDEWKEIWTDFLQDYLQHSEEKGWTDITYISMDERSLDMLEPAVELIDSIKTEDGKQFKISSALNYSAPSYYDFTDKIDDISVNLGNTSKEQTAALSEHRREKGLNTTFYTCTGDYPSNFMISDPGDNYWDMFYTVTLKTDGYMRWAFDNYVYDMHGDATYRYWEPGDGWFIYPLERGNTDLIQGKNYYSTPRYEMLRQGIRDSAKVRWLLANEDLDESAKASLQSAVDSMSKPSQTSSYGSAVASSQEVRMSVHAQTKAVADAMQAAAHTIAPEEMETIHTELLAQLTDKVDHLKFEETDYESTGWTQLAEETETAKAILNHPESQDQVDQEVETLHALLLALRLLPNANHLPTVQND